MEKNMMQVSLFIFNFRKGKIIYEALGFFFLFGLMLRLMSNILIDDSESYTRIMIHEMYSQEENIDTLFIGSSHCYRSLDTEITDQYLGNTFNAGSSSQALDASYALLVEAGKSNKIKRVFVEMYHEAVDDEYEERTELTSTYIISDYLKPSFNKYRYILNASSREYWINGLFPVRRNWRTIFDSETIALNIKNKRSNAYIDYAYLNYGWEYYAGKGYVANTSVMDKKTYDDIEYVPIKEQQISYDNLQMLYRIIEYCRKNEIELTLFVAPMPQFRLDRIGNYSIWGKQIEELVKNYEIDFFDFNLCKEEYKFQDKYFMDDHHLNKEGAEKFSFLFSRFFTENIDEKDIFYSKNDVVMFDIKED